MSDLNQRFIDAVWPEQGPYLLAVPITITDRETGELKMVYRHVAVPSGESGLERGRLISANPEQPSDVYFAVGSVKHVPHKMKGVRLQSNIAALKAFWLDVDVGQNKPYQTQAEAVAAIKRFVKTFKFPRPWLVNSGWGIHCYWTLDQSIPTGTWATHASILKAFTHLNKLHADDSRTSDCASVLRLPGTWNLKDQANPQKVEVILEGQTAPADKFLKVLRAYREKYEDQMEVREATITSTIQGVRPDVSADKARTLNEDAAGGTVASGPPPMAARIVKGCQQLLWQAQNQEQVLEPQWYDMVGTMRFTDAAPKVVHAMGRKHPGYRVIDTDRKIAQHEHAGMGPTRCETFESHRPGGCAGCPFKGKINSPITLGMVREEAPAPAPVTEGSVEIEVPPPPLPFKRIVDEESGRICVALEYENNDGRTVTNVIYDNDLYPLDIVYDQRTRAHVVKVRRYLPKDGWATFQFPMGSLYDTRRLSVFLGDIGVLVDRANVDEVIQYMVGYIRSLQKAKAATIEYAQLGWQDDKFVLPEHLISNKGVQPINPAANTKNAMDWKGSKGELEQWKRVPAMYARPGMETFQFGVMAGFAAPLFGFTNYAGMIFSLVGAAGCGKSSVALVANSIWGHSKVGWADIQRDSIKSFYNKVGTMNNLPVTYDEITNLPERELSDLCYAISKGTGRQTLNQDGSAKETANSWQTIMISTSNASLHSRLALAKSDASAEAVRVFEYYVPGGRIAKQEADATLDLLNDHYGLAGSVFMAEVVKDPAAVRQRVQHWMRRVEQEAKVTSSERFWSAGPAAVLAAVEVTNRLGLTQFNEQGLFKFACYAIERMRGAVAETVRTPVGIVSEYLNSNMNSTLILNSEPLPGKPALVVQAPRNELRVRAELYSQRVVIDRADFMRFCGNSSIDHKQLRQELSTIGALLETDRRMVLGRGTVYATGQTRCWVLDLSHPEMQGIVDESQVVADEAIAKARG